MTEKNANVRLLEAGYEKWDGSAQGVEHWMNLMSDDIRWRSLGSGAAGIEFTKQCRSKSDVLRYFAELGKQWKLISYKADEFVAQGDRVVMLGSCAWQHRGTGKVAETPKVDVFLFRDGKVIDFMEYYDTAAVLAATVP